MKRFGLLVLAVAIVVAALAGFTKQSGDQLTAPQLREILVQLGYEVTDLEKEQGKEKYSVNFSGSDLNIPMGFEVSPSGTYIWLTVNLGVAPDGASPKNLALLKENATVQPTQFYVTKKGRLMMGLALENRGLTNARLRDRADTLVKYVGQTKDTWQG
jgi:hypothetical protein